MTDLVALQIDLGVSINNPALLEQALVHSSYINENPSFVLTSNERLEFLGDAVLGVLIAEKLYQEFPQFDEGEMTKLRAALVSQDALARIADAINLGDYLYLGRGERASGGESKPSNLAGAVEALIGAVFLDKGLSAAKEFTLRLYGEELENAVSPVVKADYKSQLQEFIQSREKRKPVYHLLEEKGPAHDKTFTVEVKLGERVLGRGVGKSKRAAETEAARSALQQLQSSFTG
jgi:ribonuclease-3